MLELIQLPTEQEFRARIGRAYKIKSVLKHKDPGLEAIFGALSRASPYRHALTMRTSNDDQAHKEMLSLRKFCLTWCTDNYLVKRTEKEHVVELAHSAHHHFLAIITRRHGKSKTRLQELARFENLKQQDLEETLMASNGAHIGKTVGDSYSSERMTKEHLPHNFEKDYLAYLNSFNGFAIGLEEFYKLVVVPLKKEDPNNVLRYLDYKVGAGVKYCDLKERKEHQLQLTGDGFIRKLDGELFDTEGCVSLATGGGFAIFVVDMLFNFYAGPHSINKFHHSSFLAGAPVFSAGEMCVSNGVLVGVTNKTGHYKSGAAELHRALLLLQKYQPPNGCPGGMNRAMKHVAVCDPYVGGRDTWRSAQDVIYAKGDFNNAALKAKTAMVKPTQDNMKTLAKQVQESLKWM